VKKYPDELIQRGVRLALEGDRPIVRIAHDLGVHPETLRKRVRRAEADSGARAELLSSQARGDRQAAPRSYELRRANEILKVGVGVFRQGARRRPLLLICAHAQRQAGVAVARGRGGWFGSCARGRPALSRSAIRVGSGSAT
jgi:transposase